MGSLLGKLFGKSEETRIILAGLDAAGKTTILYRLKLGEVVTTIPTIGFNVETIRWKNVSFSAWDVGGRDKLRPLMRHYFENMKALVYVIDSSDNERLTEAKEELQSFARDNLLRESLILVFANKQDLSSAKSPMAISEALELYKLRQHTHIIPTVAVTGEGLTEGLEWIAEMLNRRHLSKDSEETLRIKEAIQDSKNDRHLFNFKKTWMFFHSLFIGDSTNQTPAE